jgi:hypothetical protein
MKTPVMSLVAVQPRDVYALFEISHKNLGLLVEAIKRCEISIDKQDPKEIQIEEAFQTFFNQINDLDKKLGAEYGDPSNPE